MHIVWSAGREYAVDCKKWLSFLLEMQPINMKRNSVQSTAAEYSEVANSMADRGGGFALTFRSCTNRSRKTWPPKAA